MGIEIKYVSPKDLKLAPYNPRRIDEESLRRLAKLLDSHGFVDPVIARKEDKLLIGGHQRLKANELREEPDEKVPCIFLEGLSDTQAKALNISLNNPHAQGEWDLSMLTDLLVEIDTGEIDVADMTAFSEADVAELVHGKDEYNATEDEPPEPQDEAVSRTGDLWLLGEHRLLCGDSTDTHDVWLVMCGEKAILLHADPPYGMGKEKEGVANDNLYREKLDAFQMLWWSAARPMLESNASAYIWGTAEDLWRLWYVGGLRDSERLTTRNEIIWDKKHGQGMDSAQHRMFPTASERCLFFMLGEQGFNNNADNYWHGWDSVVNYLREEKKKTGWDIATFKRLAGHSETSGCHWFDKSQWMFPTKKVYKAWQVAAREHDAFKREHDALRREFDATRAYFDNTHENMTDVWQFDRVKGEERHDHATPKPAAMIARAIKSSAPDGGLVYEPFSGSGTTIIACEQLSRKCYAIEIEPRYVDVAVRRWQNFTEKKATLEGDGRTFDEISVERIG